MTKARRAVAKPPAVLDRGGRVTVCQRASGATGSMPYDLATIEAILDRAVVGHVAFVADGAPVCIPTLVARVGRRIYVHGSGASRMLRALGRGAPACLTVTLVDGLVLARSAFEHSINFESVVAYGSFDPVDEPDERLAALEAFTEKILPGRWSDVRPPSTRELQATAILAMEVEEASAKVRSGPPTTTTAPTPRSTSGPVSCRSSPRSARPSRRPGSDRASRSTRASAACSTRQRRPRPGFRPAGSPNADREKETC